MTTKTSSLRRTHSDYQAYASKWKRVRDAVAGADAVREAGPEYLPKLSGMTADEYDAYAGRPTFFGATSRTSEALSGMLFAKPYRFEAPDLLRGLEPDIDLAGATLEQFAAHVVDEVLQTGRVLVVVNHNGDPAAPSLDARPYLRTYSAESILDWRAQAVGGSLQLTWLKVREFEAVQGADEFSEEAVEQFRVFDLTPEGYRQRVFREVKTANNPAAVVQVGPDVFPQIEGDPWDRMPVHIVGARNGFGCVSPPLLDLADTNIAHWRMSADLHHGAHFTGLPQPWIAGYRPAAGETVRLGSSEAWVFEDPSAKAEFLEFKGSGLGTLEKLLDRYEAQMAKLGARMLAPDKSQAESGEALSIRRDGELSSLVRISAAVSNGLQAALRDMAEWSGIDPATVEFTLSRDFASYSLDALQIAALVKAWQSGAMSLETLLWNFGRGGLRADSVSADDERELIDNGAGDVLPPVPANDTQTGGGGLDNTGTTT